VLSFYLDNNHLVTEMWTCGNYYCSFPYDGVILNVHITYTNPDLIVALAILNNHTDPITLTLVVSGIFILKTIRSMEHSFPWWNFHSRDHSFPGTFVPWTVCCLELSFLGPFVPGPFVPDTESYAENSFPWLRP